jgi:hypothetical protein
MPLQLCLTTAGTYCYFTEHSPSAQHNLGPFMSAMVTNFGRFPATSVQTV